MSGLPHPFENNSSEEMPIASSSPGFLIITRSPMSTPNSREVSNNPRRYSHSSPRYPYNGRGFNYRTSHQRTFNNRNMHGSFNSPENTLNASYTSPSQDLNSSGVNSFRHNRQNFRNNSSNGNCSFYGSKYSEFSNCSRRSNSSYNSFSKFCYKSLEGDFNSYYGRKSSPMHGQRSNGRKNYTPLKEIPIDKFISHKMIADPWQELCELECESLSHKHSCVVDKDGSEFKKFDLKSDEVVSNEFDDSFNNSL